MRLLTLLPLHERAQIDRAIGPRASASRHAANFPDLARALDSEPWSTVVINPAAVSEANLGHVGTVVSEIKCGLLLYGSLTPGCRRFLVTWADRLIVEVYFPHLDSDPTLLPLKLLAMQSPTACGRLLNAVAPHTGVLPRRIGDGVVGLFGTLPVPPSVESFSRSIAVVRKTLDRHMTAAGFVSTVAVVDAVRLAWAWDFSRGGDAGSPAHIASRCGYASEHQLWVHSQRALSVPPSALRNALPTGPLFDRLSATVLR